MMQFKILDENLENAFPEESLYIDNIGQIFIDYEPTGQRLLIKPENLKGYFLEITTGAASFKIAL